MQVLHKGLSLLFPGSGGVRGFGFVDEHMHLGI